MSKSTSPEGVDLDALTAGLDRRFRQAMDAVPAMIWVAARDKNCIWFNRRWLEFTGRRLEQELGQGWAEGVHRDDLDRCMSVYIRSFDARTPFRMEYRLRRHDGQFRWIEDAGIPRYEEDGTFLGYIGSCTDIHDFRLRSDQLDALREELEEQVAASTVELQQEKQWREQAQAQSSQDSISRKDTLDALAESEQRFRLLVQSVVDYAIFMLDAHGIVTNWNPGAERIKGYKASEIVGQHFS